MSAAVIRRITAAALALYLVWAPRLAIACPACVVNEREESRIAFIGTTVFLSVLPLLLVGGAAYAIWRRIRQREMAPRTPTLPVSR